MEGIAGSPKATIQRIPEGLPRTRSNTELEVATLDAVRNDQEDGEMEAIRLALTKSQRSAQQVFAPIQRELVSFGAYRAGILAALS
jgi:hypothetical protein